MDDKLIEELDVDFMSGKFMKKLFKNFLIEDA